MFRNHAEFNYIQHISSLKFNHYLSFRSVHLSFHCLYCTIFGLDLDVQSIDNVKMFEDLGGFPKRGQQRATVILQRIQFWNKRYKAQ